MDFLNYLPSLFWESLIVGLVAVLVIVWLIRRTKQNSGNKNVPSSPYGYSWGYGSAMPKLVLLLLLGIALVVMTVLHSMQII